MNKFKEKVKNIVKNNFKISVKKYFDFENKYNFFKKLTVALAEFINIEKNYTILDIGCGYGVSTKILKDIFNTKVVGIDISEDMINFGRKIFPDIDLQVLDGENFSSVFNESSFDIAIYNAAVFIFPDPLSSFINSYKVLKESGKIGFSHYPEITDSTGNDIFTEAFVNSNFAPPKKRTVSDLDKCVSDLEKAKFKNITVSEYSIPLDINFLTDFFLIPAQSASLFPKLTYNERLKNIKQLFSSIKEYENSAKISWKLVKAEK